MDDLPGHLLIGQVTIKSYLAGRTVFLSRTDQSHFLSLSIANLSTLGATCTVRRWSHITCVVLNSNTIHVYPYCTTNPYRIKIIMTGIGILDEIL